MNTEFYFKKADHLRFTRRMIGKCTWPFWINWYHEGTIRKTWWIHLAIPFWDITLVHDLVGPTYRYRPLRIYFAYRWEPWFRWVWWARVMRTK